jgi:hypothetical protein
MENKKAQGLPVSTIVLLVIGVVILVVLILGFTLGWNNLKSWVAPSNNVETIADQCNLACQLGQDYTFCSENKTLTTEDTEIVRTCYNLSASNDTQVYGIEKCSSIKCAVVTTTETTTK